MSQTLLELPCEAPLLADAPAPGPGRTFDDALSDLWRALCAEQSSGCPLCGGRMAPRASAGAAVVGGRCTDCGAELA